MNLLHTTPAVNLESVKRFGLLASKSRGSLPVVWFHTRKIGIWAVQHVAMRHYVQLVDVVVLFLNVPRGAARKGHIGGVWKGKIGRDFPPEWITEIHVATALYSLIQLSAATQSN